MKKLATMMIVLSGCAWSAGAMAAGHMKPGLWEVTAKSDAMKSMPKLPPEQLEKMRQMGIRMPDIQNGAMTHKMCITKEMAEREHPAAQEASREASCKPANFKTSGDSYSGDIVCDGPNMKGEGKIKGTYSEGVSYSSTYDFKGVARGHPIEQHVESTGKWLGADCGDVKPMGELAKQMKEKYK